jgi:hypothetical protein
MESGNDLETVRLRYSAFIVFSGDGKTTHNAAHITDSQLNYSIFPKFDYCVGCSTQGKYDCLR